MGEGGLGRGNWAQSGACVILCVESSGSKSGQKIYPCQTRRILRATSFLLKEECECSIHSKLFFAFNLTLIINNKKTYVPSPE